MRTVIPPDMLHPDELAYAPEDRPLLKDDAQLALATLISNYSEDEYSAFWLIGIDFLVWDIIRGARRPRTLRPREWLIVLQNLSDEIGGWVRWDDIENDVVFVSLADWLEMVKDHAP